MENNNTTNKPFCITLYHTAHDKAYKDYIDPFLRLTKFECSDLALCFDESRISRAIKLIKDPNCKLVIVDIPVPQLSKEELLCYIGEVCFILSHIIEERTKVLVLKNIKGGKIGKLPPFLLNKTIIGYQNVGTSGIIELLRYWMKNQSELDKYLKESTVPNKTSEYKGEYFINQQKFSISILAFQGIKNDIISFIETGKHQVVQVLIKADLKDVPLLEKQPQTNYIGEAYYTISKEVYEDFLLTGFAIHFAEKYWKAKVWVKKSSGINNQSDEVTLIKQNPNTSGNTTFRKNKINEQTANKPALGIRFD